MFSSACVGGPLSPEKPVIPFPAITVIFPSTGLTLKTRSRLKSVTSIFAFPSNVTPMGSMIALVASTPSRGTKPNRPAPAAALTTPLESILRMRAFVKSAKNRLPFASTAMPFTSPMLQLRPGPVSLESRPATTPVPAIAVIFPDTMSIFRIRNAKSSAIYSVPPLLFTVMARGEKPILSAGPSVV